MFLFFMINVYHGSHLPQIILFLTKGFYKSRLGQILQQLFELLELLE